jgi:GxxExxY protein
MPRIRLLHEELTDAVIGAFFKVYNTLGYGFLEYLYSLALEYELVARGHRVAREVAVTVMYESIELGKQRLDMIVDDVLVVECKATPRLAEFAERQIYNYLRATKLEVGLLLHFGPQPRFERILCARK